MVFAPGMLSAARRRLGERRFVLAEAARLPFRPQSFDKVFSYSVFHYFPDHDYVKRATASMLEVCGKGGTVLIGDVQDEAKKPEYLSYLQEYTKNLPAWQLFRLRLHRLKERLRGKLEPLEVDELFFRREFFPEFVSRTFPDCRIELAEQENVERITARRKLRYDVIIRV
jgi:ubiquinone/menaquinone biosynthesis C-methylase UbiE